MSTGSELDIAAAVEFLSWIPLTLAEAGLDFPSSPYAADEAEAAQDDMNAESASEPDAQETLAWHERRSSAGAASPLHASTTPTSGPSQSAVQDIISAHYAYSYAYASLSSATSFEGIAAIAQSTPAGSGLLLGEAGAAFQSSQSLLSAHLSQGDARGSENSSSNNLVPRSSQKPLLGENALSSNSTPYTKRSQRNLSQRFIVPDRKQKIINYQQPKETGNRMDYERIIFVYKKKHPIVISSIICHDQKSKTKAQNNTENEEQPPWAAPLPSNVMESNPEPYDPSILDLSDFHTEMNRKQMTLPSYLVFRHPISPDFTFSMLKKIFQNMVEICENKLLGLDTISLSIIYIERLILQGFVRKSNRKVVACSCIYLAAKFIEDGYHELKQRMADICKTSFQTELKSLFTVEPLVYVQLRFKLMEKTRHMQYHTDRILEEMGCTYEEYTGTKPYVHFEMTDDVDELAENISTRLEIISEEN